MYIYVCFPVSVWFRFVDSSPGVGRSSMFVNTSMVDEEGGVPAEPARRKAAATATLNISKKSGTRMKRVSSILRKKCDKLTLDDRRLLEENSELVEEFYKRRERRAVWQSRKTEQEDTKEVLQIKCEQLAQAIHDAEFLVVYTGAGISTAASIPDYRGPNGIWTLLQKGLDVGHHDLSAAEPTLTHMALSALYQQGIVRHVVSQNCDGLHLRSGLPKTAMSEVHGNMYIEVCKHCVPAREYVRTFDVTERTSIYKHTTGRRCYRCGEPLIDTIVHFGERGKLRWPLNWQGACQAANACDTILCLGSSLKVLKKYTWLWQMDRPMKKRPQLYIVNLQWTPKDKDATLKINGKCDEVMALVMKALGYELPFYSRSSDPIFNLSTPLHTAEAATSSRPSLIPPSEDDEALDMGDNNETIVAGYDVRWDGKTQGSEKCNEELEKENLEKNVKDEKHDIKIETKPDIKPVNGVHAAWNVAYHAHSLEVTNSDNKENGKSILAESDNLIKDENKLFDVKEEMDFKDDKTWNNGESFPGHYKELYKALTVKSKTTETSETLGGSVDMEEVKSEPSDSDEDFQTSDAEGEPWLSDKLEENTLDEESSCIDSDSSEQEESEVNNSDNHSLESNNIDYFKLAYASTNVQMAKQGQALLKQNDFYGTGLCIRSFVDGSKSDKSIKLISNSERRLNTSVTAGDSPLQKTAGNVETTNHRVTGSAAKGMLTGGGKSIMSSHEQSDNHTVLVGSDTIFSKIPVGVSKSSSLPNQRQSPALTFCSNECNDILCSNEYENKLTSCDCKHKSLDCNMHESDVTTVNVSCTSLRTCNQLKKTDDSEFSMEIPHFSSILKVNDISDSETTRQCEVQKIDNILSCRDESLARSSSRSTEESFLLRTHVVDGIIRTACVETLADDKFEDETIPLPSLGNVQNVPLPTSSDITRVTVPSHIDAKNVSFPLCINSSLCQENFVSKAQVSAITQHSKLKSIGSKFSSRLSVTENEELKSIWHQSFCNSSEKSLSTLAVMVGMKECRLIKCENRIPNNVNPRGDEVVPSPEKSSSVILKNICTEALNDSNARQKGSAKRKPKGCDNEDVKCIWFWGFDSNAENKEKEYIDGNYVSDGTSPTMNMITEVDTETTDDTDCVPVRRVTRSRTRASSDSRALPEVDVFKCHCNGSNPELCKTARLRPSRGACDADVEKAREIIRRRRTCNYRKYEPVFEKKLESFTYERVRIKRKSKFESVHNNEEELEEEEYYEQENEIKEDEQKISDGEDCREKDEKGERKITPGWYGKGLRKGIKKKTRV
ncbi:uncharacterized protein Sirt7 [Cherax quadricarinatus]|uniref:uncharacterized protein Sirt7 n=1 Tax=Cherax quadricarinatus TaxID=27406 RepID=UPI00387E7774